MKITALPVDIILLITEQVDALDIISLGKTCRTLHNICSQHVVWTSTVRRIRNEDVTFPSLLPDHGLDLARLQREATAPARFIALLKKTYNANESLSPQSVRYITSLSLDPNEELKTIRLLPGGHLLLTASNTALRIWDVDAQVPFLVHMWSLNVVDILMISRTRDGDLRVAVIVRDSVDSHPQLRILDFNYPSCGFKVYSCAMREWDFPDNFPLYTLSLDYFVFIKGPFLHVWNFALDQYARWSIPAQMYERMDSESSPQMIIFMSNTKLYGWKPRLPPHSPNSSVQVQELVPDFELPVIPARYGVDTIRCGLATWYGSTEYSLIFDVATKMAYDSNYTFSSFEVTPPSPDRLGGVRLLSVETLPKDPDPGLRMQLYVYRRAHNRLFKMWYNELEAPPTCYTVAFRDNPRTPSENFADDPSVEVRLLLPDRMPLDTDEEPMADANLDPSSGRLCFMKRDGDFVGIIDYLPL
ncbi:hypothetical protein CVT24_013040 [Panaeolus cyanescens]|uniref:F-box domain-containing protein n=1 Tax=Panaeolus cyanescens TaxID=181874 RepID=A0A409YUP6_9AGAR|nr:hypothetical protein CVT24_013040 [Panaeolus cyanescens]